MVRSFTSDPAAGRRFIVGMQGAQPGGTLGFGFTPQEAQELRSKRIAEDMGLAPEIADASQWIAPKQMQEMGLRSILEGQEEAQRSRLAESQFNRQMEAKRQAMAAQEAEKQQKIEYLLEQARGKGWGGKTPVETEQFIRSNPEAAEQFQTRQMFNAEDENRRVARESATRAQRLRDVGALMQGVPEEIRPEIEEKAASGTFSPEGLKEIIKQRTKGYQEEQKQAQKQTEIDQRNKANLARLQGNATYLPVYQRQMDANPDPDQAWRAVEAKIKEDSELEREKRKEAREFAKEAKSDAMFRYQRAKDVVAKMDKEGLPTESREYQEAVAEVQRASDEYEKADSYALKSTQPEPGAESLSPAGAPPASAPPPPAAAGQPAGQRGALAPAPNKPETQMATMSVRPDLLSKFAQIFRGLQQTDPGRAFQLRKEFTKIVSAVPFSSKPAQTNDSVQQAVQALLDQYAGLSLSDFGG